MRAHPTGRLPEWPATVHTRLQRVRIGMLGQGAF
jgi:hypothetical protein